MIRACAVVPASSFLREAASDKIILPHDGRYRRRVTMRAEGGLVFLLDLPNATHLQHGDGLQLEDGRLVLVIAADEPVLEITARDAHHLARIAWHLGNRHLAAEILPNGIRILPDDVIAAMVEGLGGETHRIDARFEPEAGAYAHDTHHRASASPSQEHGHAHHDDHHGHGGACHHDH